jgi:dihydrofolate reductase
MRKVIAGTFVSLDGVMQAPGGSEEDPSGGFRHGGWTVHYWDDASAQAVDKLHAAPFDLLLGRRTYEIFAAHWPYVAESDPIGRLFNRVTKYVATRSNPRLAWQNSVALRGEAASEVATLKRADGPTLLIWGSGVLIQALLAKGLIDQFNLFVFPVLLGPGKRLFGEGTRAAGLRLVHSQVSSTGVVMSTYEPGGEVRTGSFALEKPTDAELERRRKLKAEAFAPQRREP